MSEWVPTRLGDVTRQIQDSVKVETGETYPLLGVKWYAEGPFHRETVTSETSKATRFFRVRPGQFIYNRLFAWKGSFGLVGNDLDGSFVSNEFPVFECDPERLLPEFLNLHFRQPFVWDEIERVSTGTTASRNRWKEAQFNDYRIALPPLRAQHRIVEVIAALDAQVGALNDEVEWTKRCLALVRDDIPNAPKRRLAEVILGLDSGKSVQTSDEKPLPGEPSVLKLSAVQLGAFLPDEAKRLDDTTGYTTAHLVSDGDLLVTRASGSFDRVGYVAIARGVREGMHMPDLIWKIRPNPSESLPSYLNHVLSSPSVRSKITTSARGTASMRKINKALFGALLIPVPGLAEQLDYAKRCDALADALAMLVEELTRLRAFRSSLLASLLSQDVEIPDSYDHLLEVAS